MLHIHYTGLPDRKCWRSRELWSYKHQNFINEYQWS